MNIQMSLNKKIEGGASSYRPDMLLYCNTHNVIVEIDERQHFRYNRNDEVIRSNSIFTDLGSKPLIMIHFNPDKYKAANGCYKRSVFSKDRKTRIYKIRYEKQYAYRLKKITDQLDTYLVDNPNLNRSVEHIYLFFDGYE